MTAIANHPHRVTSAIADARARLASVTEVPAWSMDATETTASLDQLAALAAQVAELQARVLAHGDRTDIAAESGATSTANWHAHHHPGRAAAARTRPALRRQSPLRILGRRILEVISPDTARLTMYDDGHGKVHGSFTLDTLTGAMLKKALFAIAAPKHQASKGPLDLGRGKRLASDAQRIVKTIEAGGCEIDGCHAPPGMTHLHHQERWADGGNTNINDLITICPPHHTRAHDQRYNMTKLPTGKYTFHRRT